MFLKASLKFWWTGKNKNIQNWHFWSRNYLQFKMNSLLINTPTSIKMHPKVQNIFVNIEFSMLPHPQIRP